ETSDGAMDRGGGGLAVQRASGLVRAERGVLLGNARAGLSTATRASLSGEALVIVRSRAAAGEFGHGAIASGGSRLELANSAIEQNAAAGLVVSGAAALLTGTRVAKNPVALHLQDGVELLEVDTARPPAPNEAVVTRDCTFEENASRLGTGLLPLPPVRAVEAPGL
ncbi:MAG: hypothetical protein ACK4N5_16350, partial [Myxococcales bacterium]